MAYLFFWAFSILLFYQFWCPNFEGFDESEKQNPFVKIKGLFAANFTDEKWHFKHYKTSVPAISLIECPVSIVFLYCSDKIFLGKLKSQGIGQFHNGLHFHDVESICKPLPVVIMDDKKCITGINHPDKAAVGTQSFSEIIVLNIEIHRNPGGEIITAV